MGRKQQEVRVVVTLSDHNSERDQVNEDLFRELAAEVRRIAEQPKYDGILVFVEGD
jgi:hypothetical protein